MPTRNVDCLQVLLGYLPTDRSLWPSELAKKRSQYKQFKEELLVNPVSLHILHDFQVVNFIYIYILKSGKQITNIQEFEKVSNLVFWWLVKYYQYIQATCYWLCASGSGNISAHFAWLAEPFCAQPDKFCEKN